jgi:hypothetical protein
MTPAATRNLRNAGGFALLMVMLVLVTGVVLGISYLSSTGVRASSSRNAVAAMQAQYLAESGLEHAMFVVAAQPGVLDAATRSPQGPFFIDEAGGSYTFFCVPDPDAPGRYTVTAEASSGGIKRRSSMVVFRPPSTQHTVLHGVQASEGMSTLPLGVEVEGDVYVQGFVANWARVRGTIFASGSIFDWFNLADETHPNLQNPPAAPVILPEHYRQYVLDDTIYNAVVDQSKTIRRDDDLVKNRTQVSVGNIGGVIYLTPSNGRCELKDDVEFEGTVVVQGDLVLDGEDIHLKAVPGFPAVVVSGSIVVTRNTDAVIDGLVVAGEGVASWGGRTSGAKTRINGGLLTRYGFLSGMRGSHKIVHMPESCEVWDLGGTGGNGASKVSVLKVH